MTKGAIAFSLFGTNPMYTMGAVRNAELAPRIYPEWKAIFYCDKDVPVTVIKKIEKARGEIRGPVDGINNQMFWRFCICDDIKFTHFLIRDTDSRLNPREKGAVDEWLNSGMLWHTMADHPQHTPPIGGGLCGGKTGVVQMKNLIITSGLARSKYTRERGYDQDQIFLANYVLPVVRKSIMRHDSCNRHIYRWAVPFPDGNKFGTERFVGEIFDQNDHPHIWHWQQRINHQHV